MGIGREKLSAPEMIIPFPWPGGMPTSSWAWGESPGHAHEDVGMPPWDVSSPDRVASAFDGDQFGRWALWQLLQEAPSLLEAPRAFSRSLSPAADSRVLALVE